MSHVDEGMLHAYLDGALPSGDAQGERIRAHLAQCVDCRALLEEARALRERGASVLRHATPPDIAVPAFDEIVRRRDASRATGAVTPLPRPTRRRGYVPLAWAASLLLAVTAGWMGNQLLRGPRPESAVTATESARGPSPGAAAEAAAADAAAVPPAQATADSGETVRQRAPVAPPPAAPKALEAAPERVAARPAEQQRAGAAPPARSADASALAAADSGAARRELKGALRRFDARAANIKPPAITVMGEASRPVRDSIMPGVTVVPTNGLVGSFAATTDDAAALSLLRDAEAATDALEWRTIPDAVARERLGREPATLTGLPARGYEWADGASAPLLRNVYTLPDGTAIELLQRPDATRLEPFADAAREREAPAGRARASERAPAAPALVPESLLALRRRGLTVLLRAPLALDSLRALSLRLR